MKAVSDWNVPKWPFLTANAALLAAAIAVVCRAANTLTPADIYLAAGLTFLGGAFGCLPYVLEYRATKKLVEMNALTTVAEQLQDLKKYSGLVSTATDQWARVQESTQTGAEKTATAAREIAERMTTEIREFNEFQVKLNDTEKAALRLEVEKLRRTEGDWLQVVARILDHIYSLYQAAHRSGQPELAEQIGQFQNACRDTARRVGITPFNAEAGEKLVAERHRVHGLETPPAEGVIAETLAPGLTFQGRLIRPVLVRLQAEAAPVAEAPAAVEPAPAPEPALETATTETATTETVTSKSESAETGQLPLGAD